MSDSTASGLCSTLQDNYVALANFLIPVSSVERENIFAPKAREKSEIVGRFKQMVDAKANQSV